MFDIGFSELLIIAVVALVVLGPERLPKAARFAGLWVRRARAQWYSVKAELERDLAAEEMRRSMQEAGDVMRGVERSVRASGAQIERDFDGVREAVESRPRHTDAAAAAPDPAPADASTGEPADAMDPAAAAPAAPGRTGVDPDSPAETAHPAPATVTGEREARDDAAR